MPAGSCRGLPGKGCLIVAVRSQRERFQVPIAAWVQGQDVMPLSVACERDELSSVSWCKCAIERNTEGPAGLIQGLWGRG